MAFTPAATTPQNSEYTSHQILILSTLQLIRDSSAENNIDKAFSYTKFIIKLLLPYTEPVERLELEKNYQVLLKEIKRIDQSRNVHDNTKRDKVLELKDSFIEAHMATLMMSAGKAGIVKLKEDGLIDYDMFDVDDIESIVRHNGGLNKAIELVLLKKAEKMKSKEMSKTAQESIDSEQLPKLESV